MTELTF